MFCASDLNNLWIILFSSVDRMDLGWSGLLPPDVVVEVVVEGVWSELLQTSPPLSPFTLDLERFGRLVCCAEDDDAYSPWWASSTSSRLLFGFVVCCESAGVWNEAVSFFRFVSRKIWSERKSKEKEEIIVACAPAYLRFALCFSLRVCSLFSLSFWLSTIRWRCSMCHTRRK